MSDGSAIEWTDATWNPVRGCEKISPGCKHCYASTFAERFRGVSGHAYERGFEPRLVPEKLADPLRWSGPRLVFVNSMSDLFLDFVSDAYIRRVVDVMLAANWHTYQVLTKRASRLRELLAGPLRDAADAVHIWWGVSVEDRKYGLPRVRELQKAPARVRFLSVEPLLEDVGPLPLDFIDWVIVGGESGSELDLCGLSGCRDYGTSAPPRRFPSFSSSGEGFRKSGSEDSWTDEPTTRCHPAIHRLCPTGRLELALRPDSSSPENLRLRPMKTVMMS